MKISFKKKNIYIFVFILIYKLILDFLYIEFVYKIYSYSIFKLEFNLNKYFISFIWFIIIFYILPKDSKKPSFIFLQLHFIIMIMPMFTIYALANQSGFFMSLCSICFIIECLIIKVFPDLKIIKIKNSKKIVYGIIFFITGFVYFSMIRANGQPTLKALNFNKVYEIRSSVKYPLLMGYMVQWQARIINPFLITTSYIKNNKKALFISILLQVLLYLITVQKSFLLIPLAIIIVLNIFKKYDFLIIGSFIAPLGIISAFLVYKFFNYIMIPSLFIRRFLFVPAQLKFFYYDFFSQHEFLYFSEGLFGKILGLNTPYGIKTANMIGGLYIGNYQTNANTGYLADAYANMGIFGMLVISLLFTFILILIDSLSKKNSKELVIGLCLYSVLSLNDGALLTTLLTGGLLLLIILLYLYSNDEKEVQINKEIYKRG